MKNKLKPTQLSLFPNTRILPVREFCNTHPWPTESAMRWLIFNADKNGFDQVIRRVGRRVLIDEHAFFEWIENQQKEKGQPTASNG